MTFVGKLLKGVATFIQAGVKSVIGGTKAAVNSVVSGEGPVALQQQTATKAITLPLIIVGAVVGFIIVVLAIIAIFKRK